MKSNSGIDYRSTRMRDLTLGVRRLFRRGVPILALILASLTAYLFLSGRTGVQPFAEISAGTLFALWVWSKRGVGVPLFPLLMVQQIFLYAVPIVVNPQMMAQYSGGTEQRAGVEVLIYSLAMASGWIAGMNLISPSPPFCFALAEFKREGSAKLRKLALGLVVGATSYQILQRLGLINDLTDLLPAGSSSILWALLSAASACGFFIGSLLIGSGELGGFNKLIFWLMLGINCYIAASNFLLSAACIFVLSVAIGLFWSSGRVPWRYIIVLGVIFSFLNVGKDAMRDRYWRSGGASNIPDFTFSQMPGLYAEWFGASMDVLTGGDRLEKKWEGEIGTEAAKKANQTLLDRVNNLQNLLYVIDAVQNKHIAPMYGDSYAPIPALLIPRVLAGANKMRSQEGQVRLNVHFQRQDLNSTFGTYIAWGLLAEAYGNFGEWNGSLLLGLTMGFLFAWLEEWTANKLVVSLEGFIGFTIFLGMVNSYEMVASTLVTSIFQALIPVTAAMLPISHRTRLRSSE